MSLTTPMFELPQLPFDESALSPWTSAETISFHYGKHHAGYVKKLNMALEGHELSGKELSEIIRTSRGSEPGVFNNAAQHFNHSFFWNCLIGSSNGPSDAFKAQLTEAFGSYEAFVEQFSQTAATLFGSGWAWLVRKADGTLAIAQYKDADTPAGTDDTPLLTLDVWEHAYYVDHRNDRKAFIEGFWNHVNWEFVEQQ